MGADQILIEIRERMARVETKIDAMTEVESAEPMQKS